MKGKKIHVELFCAVWLKCPACLVCLCDFSEWEDVSVMEQEAAVGARGKKRQEGVNPQE